MFVPERVKFFSGQLLKLGNALWLSKCGEKLELGLVRLGLIVILLPVRAVKSLAGGECPAAHVKELVNIFVGEREPDCFFASNVHLTNGNRRNIHLDFASFTYHRSPLAVFSGVGIAELFELLD